MVNHGIQRSCVVPDEVEITTTKVFVAQNIHEVMVNHENDEHLEYEFNLIEFNKDEYIRLQSEQNQTIKEQMEATQEAVDFLLLSSI